MGYFHACDACQHAAGNKHVEKIGITNEGQIVWIKQLCTLSI